MSDPREELKRADHSIYVTLKYTRTTDVIRNTLKRLISSFELANYHLLVVLQRCKKVAEIPLNPRLQVEAILRLFPKLKDFLKLYDLIIRIDQAPYTKREEYRKNVTLIAQLTPDHKEEVNIDLLRNYFNKTVEYVNATILLRHDLSPPPKPPTKSSSSRKSKKSSSRKNKKHSSSHKSFIIRRRRK